MNFQKSRISKFIDYAILFLASLVTLPSLYLLFLGLNLPIPYIQLSNLHQVIIFSALLLLFLVLYNIHLYPGWEISKGKLFLRDFLLAIFILSYPFVLFYSNPNLSISGTFQVIKPYIQPAYYALLGITVLAVLFAPKDDLKRVNRWFVGEIDARHLKDEEAETRRVLEFNKKYPKFAEIKFVGEFCARIWAVGSGYLLGLLLLATAGLVLRMWNLDTLAPYTDELNHLIAARNIAQGLENIQQISYRRSLYTVTLPVALFSKLFGFDLWQARFVGVLANIFAIIPLYLLSKRINKTIAFLAVGLYIFSPWMIAVARNVREHAYYALFFFLVALVMVKLFESIPENIILLRDYRSLISLKILFLVSILVIIIFYVYVIDIFSTFKIILIYYPIFGIILLKKFDWTDVSNRIVLVLFLTIAGVGIGLIIAVIGGESMSIHRLNAYFLSLFYEKPPQQWYFNRPLISICLIFFAIVATPLRDPKKFVHPFSSLVYIISLFTYSFIFTVGNRPRYSITILFWHIILMAIGLFVAYIITNRLITINRKWLIWPVLLLVFWNIPQTFAPVLYNKPGRHPITDEYHGTLEPAYGFLQANVQADDVVVISDYLNKNYQLLDGLNSDNVISIYREDAEPIYEAIESYPSGWIVIDAPRGFDYSKPIPLEDFSYAGKRVVFWGWFSDNYIYKWGNGS